MDLNMKILIVDDFPEVTRLIRNILKNIGFTNIRKTDGGKAFRESTKIPDGQRKSDVVMFVIIGTTLRYVVAVYRFERLFEYEAV